MLTSLNVKFSLYLKKAGLARRNMVQHLPKKTFHVVSVSASIFLISMSFDGSIDGGSSREKRYGIAKKTAFSWQLAERSTNSGMD